MTENLFQNKENQPNSHIIIQLEEARIGDQDRLESIKKDLSIGKELSESDRQYLEEQATELQNALEHQTMVEWAMDFVQNLQEKENKKSVTLDEIKASLEKEKNMYKIGKKFLKSTSSQLKQEIIHEREKKETLSLISQLKETKIGDHEKLSHISRLLKSGQKLDDSDKQYLREKSKHLNQIIDCKTKVTKTKEASRKLQEVEIKHSQKLQEIQSAVENGKLVTEREQRYLNARYEKFQNALDHQNKVEWTIQTIQKLEDFGVGNPTRLDKIKELLEDELPVPENDVTYLREEYKMLREMIKHKRKIDWTVTMINELQAMEIGNPERLGAIKQALVERRTVPENEINYLTSKCKILLMTKKSESDYDINNENNTEKIPYDTILAELNTAIKESEQLESKFQA